MCIEVIIEHIKLEISGSIHGTCPPLGLNDPPCEILRAFLYSFLHYYLRLEIGAHYARGY